jgi:uncharacterized C2H2 Zn-finger protein
MAKAVQNTEQKRRVDTPVQCDQCSRTFVNAGALANHKKSAHAPGALAKAVPVKGEYPCPECSNVYKFAKGLGVHRNKAHGVPGTSTSAVNDRKRKERQSLDKAPANGRGKFPCPECEEVFVFARTLAKHRIARHGAAPSPQSVKAKANRLARLSNGSGNGTGVPHAPTSLSVIEGSGHSKALAGDPFLYAVAIGSIKEYCRNLAEEHDIPARQFARGVAELFRDQARR